MRNIFSAEFFTIVWLIGGLHLVSGAQAQPYPALPELRLPDFVPPPPPPPPNLVYAPPQRLEPPAYTPPPPPQYRGTQQRPMPDLSVAAICGRRPALDRVHQCLWDADCSALICERRALALLAPGDPETMVFVKQECFGPLLVRTRINCDPEHSERYQVEQEVSPSIDTRPQATILPAYRPRRRVDPAPPTPDKVPANVSPNGIPIFKECVVRGTNGVEERGSQNPWTGTCDLPH